MKKESIYTDEAPPAIGPYSQGIAVSEYKKIIFFSGQIALDPQAGQLVAGGIEAETKQIFRNIQSLLHEANANFSHIAKTTIFLKNMQDFSKVNELYAQHFKDKPPARSTVEVSGLPKNALIEIECVIVL